MIYLNEDDKMQFLAKHCFSFAVNKDITKFEKSKIEKRHYTILFVLLPSSMKMFPRQKKKNKTDLFIND